MGQGHTLGWQRANVHRVEAGPVYKDWYLLLLVMGLGVSGLLTQLLRLVTLFDAMAVVYAIHLILVWSLFAYLPFSKLAHLVYRTVAMTYQEYSGRQ